jgi:uncharacterized damage-inducible protein DinB
MIRSPLPLLPATVSFNFDRFKNFSMIPTRLSNIRELKRALFFAAPFLLLCVTTKAQFNETVKAQLVKEWRRAKAYTLEYLDAVPKDKYGFKAQDSVRSFAQQMLHLSQDIVIMISLGTGKERIWQGQLLEQRPSAQAADSVKYFVIVGYDYGINAIQSMDASTFEEKVRNRNFEETRFAWLLKAFEHQTHHRGQTTIYIRLLGLKPPPEKLF